MHEELSVVGIGVPEILMPDCGTDMTAWAVVACDQYTSEPEYWEKVEALVGDKPSTYRLMLPEIFLETEREEAISKSIQEKSRDYLASGILKNTGPGFILLDRATSHAPSRKGLVVSLDLEQYDYNKGSTSLIRATEGTILDRLPPRIRVREKAPIELPHIMVLIDDPDQTVIEPLFDAVKEPLYDFDLMLGGGHLRGYQIRDDKLMKQIAAALSSLADPAAFNAKYDVSDEAVLLYAMGDGNHSLATAKAIWEKVKETASDKDQVMNHPARHALVELVNVHDAGLVFEPIHRVCFGVDRNDMEKAMLSFFKEQGTDCQWGTEGVGGHEIAFVSSHDKGVISITNPALTLEVATLQSFLDLYVAENEDVSIDYIHGSEAVEKLGGEEGNIGFYLPGMDKNDLFKTIILDGALPRKTFSMGEADEKRYYLECRKIKE